MRVEPHKIKRLALGHVDWIVAGLAMHEEKARFATKLSHFDICPGGVDRKFMPAPERMAGLTTFVFGGLAQWF